MSRRSQQVQQWLSRRTGVKRSVAAALDRGLGLARRLGLATRYPLVTATHRLTPPGWPAGLRLRAAVLADLHYGGSCVDDGRLAMIIDRTADLRPDVVFLLGDYGASHLSGEPHRLAMRRLAAQLGRLRAPLGTVAVLGNHDWWDDPDAQRRGRVR